MKVPKLNKKADPQLIKLNEELRAGLNQLARDALSSASLLYVDALMKRLQLTPAPYYASFSSQEGERFRLFFKEIAAAYIKIGDVSMPTSAESSADGRNRLRGLTATLNALLNAWDTEVFKLPTIEPGTSPVIDHRIDVLSSSVDSPSFYLEILNIINTGDKMMDVEWTKV